MSGRVLVIVGSGLVVVAGLGLLILRSGSTPAPEPGANAALESQPAVAEQPASPPAAPAAAEPAASRSEVAPRPATTAERAPTTGTLRIVSDVPDTSVFIDRKYLGTAPVTVPDVVPGSYTLVLSATGYDSISEQVDVEPGEREISIRFKEIRLDASIGVVHKHAFGSCRGTLSATPKGLVYTTDHRDDAFSVALTDLETFEVDYLANNLRVKTRGGKTFNFEDPDKDRDRIFVFHRDVDKARQRMLAGG